jgi:hypothetical protein
MVDNNPVRKTAEERDAENYKKFVEEGGWEKVMKLGWRMPSDGH